MGTHAHIGLAHLLLERAALGVGAVEDGDVAIFQLLFLDQALYLPAHNACLALVGDGLVDRHLVAVGVLAIHVLVNLAAVVLHQRVGCRHDVLCGSVVSLQLE